MIDESLSTYATVDAPATWVLSNHDVVRHVSRLGRPQAAGRHSLPALPPIETLDRELGTRRARAAALLMFALPASCVVTTVHELQVRPAGPIPTAAHDAPVDLVVTPERVIDCRPRRGPRPTDGSAGRS